MKIALLSAFYPYRGGIAQFGAMFYRALEQNHEVKAYTFKRQYPDFLFPGTSQTVTDQDNVDEIPAVRILDSMQPFTYRKTAKAMLQFEPDLVISQYWMTFFGPSIGSVHKRIGKKVKRIAILHNVIPHEKRFFDRPANRFFLKHNDAFVVMSDTVMNDLLSLKPDAKYLRIDHPVYSQFGDRMERDKALEKLKLSKDKKYLLFFGFIRAYKGLDLLLETLASLDETYHVIVAGETYGSFDKYEEVIKKHQLSERVHLFTEYISDEDVATYFSASDVCMLPYKNATQSGITAIAHHFNTPIIATDVGGLKETISHNETGLIVERPNEQLLKAAIQTYFKKDLKQTMSTNIRNRKAANNWENFTDKILEFSKTI